MKYIKKKTAILTLTDPISVSEIKKATVAIFSDFFFLSFFHDKVEALR